MRLLFSKPKLIGDALLLTGTLRAVRNLFPNSEIHVLVRKGTESILDGCPDISEIHLTKGNSGGGLIQELKLLRRLRAIHFDYAFELGDGDRGRTLSVLSGAKRHFANSAAFKTQLWNLLIPQARPETRDDTHVVLWDVDVVRQAFPELPRLAYPPVFERRYADFAWVNTFLSKSKPAFIHPVASRPGKLWTTEGWTYVVKELLRRNIPVLLSSGPAESEVALCEHIYTACRDPRIRMTQGALAWASVAGALFSSRLYIGADTAAMHLASACGIPIVALFAHPPESKLSLWHPLGVPARIAQPDHHSLALSAVNPSTVLNAALEILAEDEKGSPSIQ
jgi:heptosyltransferase III